MTEEAPQKTIYNFPKFSPHKEERAQFCDSWNAKQPRSHEIALDYPFTSILWGQRKGCLKVHEQEVLIQD